MKSLYDYCYECDLLHLLVQWDGEKNGDLTTQDVTYGSHKKVWWQCEEGHIWKAAIYSRTSERKHGCPVCAGCVKQTSPWYRYG